MMTENDLRRIPKEDLMALCRRLLVSRGDLLRVRVEAAVARWEAYLAAAEAEKSYRGAA